MPQKRRIDLKQDLKDLKLQSLRRQMEIRREMQLREAERKLERTFKTHSNIDKGSRGQLVKESEVISKVEENKQAQQTMEASKTSDKVERQQNNVSINLY